MQGLNASIELMARHIEQMPPGNVRRLEQSLRQLSPEQTEFARVTLEVALTENQLTSEEYRLYEYLFERWWAHTLETKLVAISYVASLSESDAWPGDHLLDLADVAAPRGWA